MSCLAQVVSSQHFSVRPQYYGPLPKIHHRFKFLPDHHGLVIVSGRGANRECMHLLEGVRLRVLVWGRRSQPRWLFAIRREGLLQNKSPDRFRCGYVDRDGKSREAIPLAPTYWPALVPGP